MGQHADCIPPKKVLIMGAGTMGRGIAQWFAQNGVLVELIDNSDQVIEESSKEILGSWKKLQEKGKFTEDEVTQFKKNFRLKTTDRFDVDPDLAIEAIPERWELKVDLLIHLDEALKKRSMIASNTSGLSLTQMSQVLPLERRKRFFGLHFFNPAPIMKLVELVHCPQTSRKALEGLKAWFQEKGKVPVICEDSPGFIVNRIARSYYGEPMRIMGHLNYERVLEIDKVLKEVGGFKMGPFELMDLIGNDINLKATESVWRGFYDNPRFTPHRIQQNLVDSGQLGRKSGRGFYNYEK